MVSSRKYRPSKFDDVVGQEAITSTLDRAIRNKSVAPALLFCGPHGVGKTTCARILARLANELYTKNIVDNIANDFNIFELDAASHNSVEDIRHLIEQVRFSPQAGRYKIYIIDEVHMLSQAAFNAFLKTLEEPPSHVIFILSTTAKHKVLPTILSRCQIYEFRKISITDIYTQLKKITLSEKIETEDEALYLIAQHADGALRDALSIFDRIISFSGQTLTVEHIRCQLGLLDQEYYFKIVELILIHDIRSVLVLFNKILQQGFDGQLFIRGLAEHFRNLMVASDTKSISLIEMSKSVQSKYILQATNLSTNFLLKSVQLCQRVEIECTLSRIPRLSLEIGLMTLASFINSDGKSEIL